MIKVALTVAYGALLRTESRGAHSREDYPKRDDANWLKRSITTWKNENDTMPTMSYEDISIANMEMPPGFRGYGKDLTEHNSETKVRQATVDIIKQRLEEEGANRFEIQNALMPYLDKLPKKYRGINERLGENV
jgi:fumarate reductase flavoprotein subunit